MIDLNYVQASPCIRFNKEGTLLAISTRENGVKILANAEAPMITTGSRERERERETVPTDKSRIASSSKSKVKQNNREMSVELCSMSCLTLQFTVQSLPALAPTTVVVAPKSDAGTSTTMADRKTILTAVVTPVSMGTFFLMLVCIHLSN